MRVLYYGVRLLRVRPSSAVMSTPWHLRVGAKSASACRLRGISCDNAWLEMARPRGEEFIGGGLAVAARLFPIARVYPPCAGDNPPSWPRARPLLCWRRAVHLLCGRRPASRRVKQSFMRAGPAAFGGGKTWRRHQGALQSSLMLLADAGDARAVGIAGLAAAYMLPETPLARAMAYLSITQSSISMASCWPENKSVSSNFCFCNVIVPRVGRDRSAPSKANAAAHQADDVRLRIPAGGAFQGVGERDDSTSCKIWRSVDKCSRPEKCWRGEKRIVCSHRKGLSSPAWPTPGAAFGAGRQLIGGAK